MGEMARKFFQFYWHALAQVQDMIVPSLFLSCLNHTSDMFHSCLSFKCSNPTYLPLLSLHRITTLLCSTCVLLRHVSHTPVNDRGKIGDIKPTMDWENQHYISLPRTTTMVSCSDLSLTTLFYTLSASAYVASIPTSDISRWEGSSVLENALAYGVAVHTDTVDVTSDEGFLLDDTLALVVTDTVNAIVDAVILDPKDEVVSLVEPAAFTPTATVVIQSPQTAKLLPRLCKLHRP
ncbi:hypothetical protein DFS33DRAFT_963500 [Desarmillaria ectypa]|nr:hypothetical protein DFS33DRAFT_963500 [Desarmillaria ectypa]